MANNQKLAKLVGVLLIVFTFLTVVCSGYIIFLDVEGYITARINSFLSIIISSLVMVYMLNGYAKKVAFAYKYMTIFFALTCLITNFTFIQMDTLSAIIGITLNTLAFACAFMIAFVKDLGALSSIRACIILVLLEIMTFLLTIVFKVEAVNVIRTLTSLFHALIIWVSTFTKYQDKALRNK